LREDNKSGMNYKEKPFVKPRQTGATTDKTNRTGHRKDYSKRFKEMESWMDKHVTGQRKTSEEDTRLPPIQKLSEREADEVARDGEVQTWSPDRIFEDTEDAVNEDNEENNAAENSRNFCT
jgi:hypothetical protein